MDFGNIVKDVLSSSGVNAGSSEQQQGVANSLMQMVANHGGVGGIADKLRSAGLGSQVDSWIGTGANQPVQPQQIEQGLGQDKIQQLAAHAGVPPAVASAIAAVVLPALIDRLTPNGQVPQGNTLSGGLGGMLGKIMGR